MNSSRDYKYFADNDYDYYMASVRSGFIYNHMASQAQEICEKYLKHIVDKYLQTENEQEENNKQVVLHSHNLRAILKSIESAGIEVPKSIKTACCGVDGFYFNSRYPGEDSMEIAPDDLEVCTQSVEEVRAFVEAVELSIKQNQ